MLKLFTLCIKNKKQTNYYMVKKNNKTNYYMVRDFWDTLYMNLVMHLTRWLLVYDIFVL